MAASTDMAAGRASVDKPLAQQGHQCFADDSPRPEQPGTNPPAYTHTFDAAFFRAYWSGDPDYRQTTNASEPADSLSQIGRIPCASDITFMQPPNVEAWNDRELERYRRNSRSAYPTRAAPTSGVVDDTYIEIFAVNPLTVVHQPEGTTQYASPNGTVRTIGAYSGSAPRCPDENDIEISCHVQSTTVDHVALYVDGERQDTASSPTAELQYHNLSGQSTLTVQMQVTVTVEKRWDDPDENDTDVAHPTFTTTVSDSRQVTAYKLNASEITVSLADHRNSTGVSMTVPDLWRSASFETGDTIHSRWRFYTRSPEGWAAWNSTSGGEAPVSQTVRPLQVHAIPAKQGPLANSDQHSLAAQGQFYELGDDYDRIQRDFVVTHRPGPEARTPLLGPEILLNQSATTTRTDRVTVRANNSHSFRAYSLPNVTGIVRGSYTEGRLSASKTVSAYPANMTASVVNRTRNATTLSVTVESTRGYPVDFGTVTVTARNHTRSHTLQPTERGTFTITLPARGIDRVLLTYRPKSHWWEQSNPVFGDIVATERTTTVESVASTYPLFETIVSLIVATALWFLPLGLLLYGIDIWTNGRLLGLYSP
ncbi:hypothetical protein [Haloarcula sp. JP-L23]|uniref:hypothetical protein n=1 Tax=Haloarcula sp. JP-L23 TaxID=2716717 RepID=UPI00140EBE34|nr:hypothetical protein G9465_22135 [Haloarcula sp. JP-L23]